MRGIWAGSPALLLGLLAAGSRAQDVGQRPVIASTPTARVALTTPTGPAATAAVVIASSAPRPTSAVHLGRPMAADLKPETPPAGSAIPDPRLQPASFIAGLLTVRAKAPDVPQPMPIGPPLAQGPVLKGPPLIDTTNDPMNGNGARTPAGLGQPMAMPSTPLGGVPASGPAFAEGTFASDPWCGCVAGTCDGAPEEALPLGPDGGPSHLFWLRAEYLLWKISNSHLPPIVTTSPPNTLGVLGQPGTTVLFGGSVNENEFSGGRFTAGLWLDCAECFGLEGSYFFLGPRSVNFNASSGGIPVLTRPFFDVSPPPGESVEQVANPALPGVLPLAGAVNVKLNTLFQGGEINGLCNCYKDCLGRFDWIVGFRYLRLRDSLDINEDLLVPATSPIAAGQRTQLNDHFDTRNQFYGGQTGFRTEWHWGRWGADFTTKVALGTTHEQANVNGITIITPAGGTPNVFTGGLFAQPTNIGHYSRDRFAVVPEVGLNLSYQVTDHWRLFAGYSFIYWSTVARPGDQIDRMVNSGLIPPRQFPAVGPQRPVFNFKDTDFWAYGVNFGMEFRY